VRERHTRVSEATCKGCVHYRRLSDSHVAYGIYACHYCFDTGVSRGCDIIGCTRKRSPASLTPAERRELRYGKFAPVEKNKLRKATKSD
jgi:hypothetical protein